MRNIWHEVLINPEISSEFLRNHKKSAEIMTNPENSREIDDRIPEIFSEFMRNPEKYQKSRVITIIIQKSPEINRKQKESQDFLRNLRIF